MRRHWHVVARGPQQRGLHRGRPRVAFELLLQPFQKRLLARIFFLVRAQQRCPEGVIRFDFRHPAVGVEERLLSLPLLFLVAGNAPLFLTALEAVANWAQVVLHAVYVGAVRLQRLT